MKPYYQQDGQTIYLGDCREILPTLEKVDLVVSSPPYNVLATSQPSGLMKEHNHKKNAGYISHDDNMTPTDYLDFIIGVFQTCFELSDLMWINHQTKYTNRIGLHPARIYPWPIFSEVIWNRNGSTVLNANRYAPSHEHILGFGNPIFWDRCNDMKLSVWNIRPEYNVAGHPCPFPLEIPRRLIASSCPFEGNVIDPFMGSGTTLRAAKDLGRHAIGIEIEERYCEIAANRLRQGVLSF